jgi:hypothetical protein
VLPLGYSFNLDGSMIYTTFAALFIGQAYGIPLTLGTQITMLLVLMVSSKGIAGVPRSSLVVVAAVLPMFGLPEAGLLLILGIDHFLDMGRTATNVLGNAIATAVVAKWEKAIDPVDDTLADIDEALPLPAKAWHRLLPDTTLCPGSITPGSNLLAQPGAPAPGPLTHHDNRLVHPRSRRLLCWPGRRRGRRRRTDPDPRAAFQLSANLDSDPVRHQQGVEHCRHRRFPGAMPVPYRFPGDWCCRPPLPPSSAPGLALRWSPGSRVKPCARW